MSGAHGDPEEIRNFARRLDEYCSETIENLQKLNSIVTEMGSSTWTDEKYRQYVETFEQSRNQLTNTIAQIQPEQIQHLNQLAQRLEEYLLG